MIKKRVSIKDIAEIAGVSHPTVSRALRGQGRMSDDTRARILAVAQDVGYTPSLMARGLVTQRSFCIGLIVPTFSDPFHSEVAQGLESEARKRGYSLFLASTEIDPLRELEVARSFQGRQVDGIVVSSSSVGNAYSKMLQETGIPIVLINSMTESDEIHTIYHDDYHGGCQIVQHLIERGHRRIAYLGSENMGRSDTERKRAWRSKMEAASLDAELAVSGPNGRLEGGASGVVELLERASKMWSAQPDAICCYNDAMAIGAISVLRSEGYQIPKDVAVTGFDDLNISAVVDPPLTTIHQPRHEMGVRAMQILLNLLGSKKQTIGNSSTNKETLMPGNLIVRQSA